MTRRTAPALSRPGSRIGAAANPPASASARREAILSIAAEIFAQKGFVSTSVREVADAAGIFSGSLYHHFDSKETMVDEIITGFIEEMLGRYKLIVDEIEDPLEALHALILAAFGTIVTDRAAMTVAHNESQYLLQFDRFDHLSKGYAKIDKLWISVLQRGMASGVFKPDMDVKFVYLLIRDSVWVAARLIKRTGRHDVQRLVDTYIQFALDGIAVGVPETQSLGKPQRATAAARAPRRRATG